MTPRLEPLEPRLAPVVGAFAPPAGLGPGSGFDGVVRLEHIDGDGYAGSSSGTLLATGRHVLTAGHVLSDENGIDSLRTNVVFELLDGTEPRDITLSVPASFYRIHPQFDGDPSNGNDIAVLTLPDQVQPRAGRQMVAPFGAERYGIYTDSDELGQSFTVVGYGRIGTGTSGSQEGSAGDKHLGRNRFDAFASTLAGEPLNSPAPAGESALAWDFDNGSPANDAFGVLFSAKDGGLGSEEANPAQGDSGGPLFLGGKIAAVVSYSDGGVSPPDINTDIDRGFGEFGVATRVSAFQDFVTSAMAGSYDLVLDMNYQLTGADGRIESLTITARRAGANLELVVSDADNSALNGVYYSAPLADIRSLTIRGSDDHEVFRVEGDLGVSVTVVGRGGNDTLLLDPGTLRRGVAFQGGDGFDTVAVTADSSFTLNPTRLTVAGVGVLALAGVESARLTGGGSANRFSVTGWRGVAALDGLGGRDTLIVSPGVGVAGPVSRGVVRLAFNNGELSTVRFARVESAAVSVGATAANASFAALLTTASATSNEGEFLDTVFRATHGRGPSAEELARWTQVVRHVGREPTARLALTLQPPGAARFRDLYRSLLLRGYSPRLIRRMAFGG